MADEKKRKKAPVVETLEAEIARLNESIRNDDPLHVRDRRAEPDDGYGNYITIAEAVVLDRFRSEKEKYRDSLVALADYLRRPNDRPE